MTGRQLVIDTAPLVEESPAHAILLGVSLKPHETKQRNEGNTKRNDVICARDHP